MNGTSPFIFPCQPVERKGGRAESGIHLSHLADNSRGEEEPAYDLPDYSEFDPWAR